MKPITILLMPTDTKCQYYDVDHNPINHDYYDHPIYKSQKWSKPMDTITPESLCAMGYDIKSSRNGKITITVKTCEFSPANFDKKAR